MTSGQDEQSPHGTSEDDPTRPSSKPWWRRSSTKIFAAATAGLIAGVTALASEGVVSIGHKLVSGDVLSVQLKLLSPGRSCEKEPGWAFPRESQSIPVPTPSEDEDTWAANYGGIPASGYYITLTLQPVQQRTVIVDSVSVRVVAREQAAAKSHLTIAGECGGIEPYYFKANLDSNPIDVSSISGQDTEGNDAAPVPLPHKLTEGDPEVWQVAAFTNQCKCSWVINIHWTSDGDEGSVIVDNHGRPFETESTAGLPLLNTDWGTPPKWTPF